MNSMLAWVVQLRAFLDVALPCSEMVQGPISKKAPSMEEPPGPLRIVRISYHTPRQSSASWEGG